MIDKNKKILITGASGFIGSNLAELLIDTSSDSEPNINSDDNEPNYETTYVESD